MTARLFIRPFTNLDPGHKHTGVVLFRVSVSPDDGSHLRVGGYNCFEIVLIVEYDDLIVLGYGYTVGVAQCFTAFRFLLMCLIN